MKIIIRKTIYYISLIFFMTSLILAQEVSTLTYKKLGTLNAFWHFEPVIGRWLSEAQGQIKIPDYMYKNSFSYVKHNFDKEVPFAAGLSVVRLLGGWNYTKKRGELNGQKNADLVYLKEGKLHYRWNLLKKRLDPYVLAGYKDLTLVLDNIPWDFAKKEKLSTYGQVNPPYDLKKWETFIEKMMDELVQIYGYALVKQFRFRLGTENQHKQRFNGTYAQYLNLYLSTQKATHKILPHAQIAPFNFAGGKGQIYKTNIDMSKFMSLVKNDMNMSKPDVDFLPVSTYYVVRKKHKKNMRKLLDARSEANRRYFNTLFEVSKQTFPKEIHEFGILNNTLNGVRSGEPGVRGAAWRMYMIQNMMENNISRLYHWGTFDRVSKDKYLLKGNGWNYSILEHLVGGEAYLLPAITEDTFHHKTLVVKKDKKVYLLTTVFPDRRDDWFEKNITISIPMDILPKEVPKTIKWTYLTRVTSVMDVIHNDLLANRMLDTSFLADHNVVGRVNSMGGKEGRRYVLKHWSVYTQKIVDSLTLKPFVGEVNKGESVLEFNIHMNIPSINIIELNF